MARSSGGSAHNKGWDARRSPASHGRRSGIPRTRALGSIEASTGSAAGVLVVLVITYTAARMRRDSRCGAAPPIPTRTGQGSRDPSDMRAWRNKTRQRRVAAARAIGWRRPRRGSSRCVEPREISSEAVHRLAGAIESATRGFPRVALSLLNRADQYIPPMPPPGAASAGFSSFFSTTTHSVVRSKPAIDAAFWSAKRVTLVGSITPAFTRSS